MELSPSAASTASFNTSVNQDAPQIKQEKRIIFVGAPGCGKGTQSSLLKDRFKLGHLSTGDMLREAVAAKTELGKQAKMKMDNGELVSDDIVLGLIEDKITGPDCKYGFILDGFPRNTTQAEGLDQMAKKSGQSIDAVIYFDISDELLIGRICGRRVHLPSGRVYHVQFNPPKREGLDDVTGEELTHRKDDNEETLKKRLDVFHRETMPLIEYYKQMGLLHTIDASAPVSKITEKLLSIVEDISIGH
ncbi:LOW QUALITY PROTEIN: adenylate kinase-like [Condylostylus longicornis]|uniref:LOW QUALITY PROTEIN: adenylate kinase-like n=1 Tax=Condylostylus longicornis TaxID=2530218 RepID=UPI00244DC350|nr:LOW QUALITY PROTEIN: adenylate kinase-like [Condylostylus longicornis]